MNIKIKSIKRVGIKPVYDIINVNKNNNYIANNFVVHNSENKELKKKLAEIRTKHLLFIMCFPLKINKIDKNYLDSFINYWCLTGDTKINVLINNKPKKVKIKRLVNLENYKVLSYNTTTKNYEYKTPDKTILTKSNAEVFELILNNNYKIKATEDHEFLTNIGYKKLKDLIDERYEIEIKIYVDDSLDRPGSILFPSVITSLSDSFKKRYIKIKSIKKLEKREDVYDIIGVEDNHNFVANNMVVHNCDLYARGKGVIYIKDRNPLNDSWRMKDFQKLGSFNEFTDTTKIEKVLSKHPNFWQMISFPKPPDWLYERYLKVRERNVYDDDNVLSTVSSLDVQNALLVLALRDIMINDTTMSVNRILLHIRNEYDIPISKKAVEHAIEDAKQLVQKIREEGMNVIKNG